MKSSSAAVILVGHGSRVAGFEKAMRQAVRSLEKRLTGTSVHEAYLEINAPALDQAIDSCVAAGSKTIKILPYFLLTGRHVREDIPKIVREAALRHKGVARVKLCPYLGFDSRIIDVLLTRLKSAQ